MTRSKNRITTSQALHHAPDSAGACWSDGLHWSTNVMSMKKLTDRIGAELHEQTRRASEDHASKIKLAELWDSHCEANPLAAQCMQPWIMHTSRLFGAVGSYAFRDATPEQCAELLAAFVPVPTAIVKTQLWTSWRPSDYVDPKLGGGEQIKSKVAVIGGATMGLDRTQSGSTVKVSWYTMLSDSLVGLDVQLHHIHGVTPKMDANVRWDNEQRRILHICEARPAYPIEPALPLSHIRYSSGGAEYFPHITIYNNVPAYIEQLAGYCYSQRLASRKAYQEDKCASVVPPPTGKDLDADYARQSLKAGTLEQYKCLHSPAAEADKALAERHWKAYAEDYNIESTQSYFDYYSWACAYLKRKGLYEVPHPRDSTKTYKYGHAWL